MIYPWLYCVFLTLLLEYSCPAQFCVILLPLHTYIVHLQGPPNQLKAIFPVIPLTFKYLFSSLLFRILLNSLKRVSPSTTHFKMVFYLVWKLLMLCSYATASLKIQKLLVEHACFDLPILWWLCLAFTSHVFQALASWIWIMGFWM